MKKCVSIFLAIFLLILVLNACQFQTMTQSTVGVNNKYTVLKEDNGYYSYKVLNSNNEVIESGESWKEPQICMIGDNILCFTLCEGPLQSNNWGFFYDYATDTRSKNFSWILDYSKETVVLGMPDRIIIRSIFDDSYYEEITSFSCAVANVPDGIVLADLEADGSEVTVTYIKDESFEFVTEVIKLK